MLFLLFFIYLFYLFCVSNDFVKVREQEKCLLYILRVYNWKYSVFCVYVDGFQYKCEIYKQVVGVFVIRILLYEFNYFYVNIKLYMIGSFYFCCQVQEVNEKDLFWQKLMMMLRIVMLK